jgi:hypothetical protein
VSSEISAVALGSHISDPRSEMTEPWLKQQ